MEALRRYKVRGYPTIVFTSSDGGRISEQVGFITPTDFAPVIEAAVKKEEIFVAQRTELEKMPDDPKLNAQVALAYLERTQPEKAFPLGKKAIEQDPKNSTGLMPNLHNELGLAYATKGEMAQDAEEMTMFLEKAIGHFKIVVDKYPKNDVNELAQYYLGVTYALKQDYDNAISVLEKLVHHTRDDIIRRNTEAMLTQIKELAGVK